MGLVDSIYESNQEKKEEHPLDEFGLAIWDNLDYFVARALAHIQKTRISPYTVYQPHMLDGELYNGNTPMEENLLNIYKLIQCDRPFTKGEQVLFWEKLKKCLPHLYKDIFQISDHLFWDRENGEVLTDAQIRDRFNPYGNDEKVS